MFVCEKCGLEADLAPEDFPLLCACGARYEAGELRGVGDVVAKLTKAVGIRPCGKCAQRRQKLNSIFPFSKGNKTRK